jgi:hypothetical protein
MADKKVVTAVAVLAIVLIIVAVYKSREKHPKMGFVDWTGPYAEMQWPMYPTFPPYADLNNAYMN